MGTPPPPQGRWMESLQGSSSGDHKRVGKGKKCVWGSGQCVKELKTL